MENAINKINRKDVAWNYAATILQIGGSIILMPFVLRSFPQETVGVWNIFITIVSMAVILDFGFSPAFARNISYVMSGVTELKSKGLSAPPPANSEVDYGLLKGLIGAMKWFYARIALAFFALLATGGTYYLYSVLQTYGGSHREAYAAWAVLIAVNSYSFYALQYDALMFGKGLVRRSLQIRVVGKAAHLAVAITLILCKFNLIAIVSAQAVSVILQRTLAYFVIYTPDFKRLLRSAAARPKRDFLRPILPNALKLGLNGFVGSLSTHSMLLIAATFFTLEEIASYGITNQVAAIIWSIGLIYWGTYAPKIYQKQVQADNDFTKRTIIYACAIALLTFAVLGGGAMLLGNWALTLIGSKTLLLPQKYILAMLILMCYNVFVGICAGFEVARNRIPFLYGTFITAALTLGIFFTAVKWLDMGMFSIIIAPIGGLAHLWWMRATIGSLGFARGDLRSAARIFWDFTKQKLLRRQ